jgi:hypothetical protein
MADTHGHAPKAPHASHPHPHDAPEEDAVRTPLWLTFVGLGLLLLGSLSTYLFVYPGTMRTPQASDDGGGSADASGAEASAPTGARAGEPGQPAAPGAQPGGAL